MVDYYELALSYCRIATAHLPDETMYYTIKDAMEWPDKKRAAAAFDKILKRTKNETKKGSVREAKRYILNNWDGIEIKEEKAGEIVGCSAEGHVSHVYSKGSAAVPRGVDQMAQLRIYKRNGGKIYDLVMAQKKKEQKEKEIREQEELINSFRRASARYEDAINTNLTVLQAGHKTALYRAFRP